MGASVASPIPFRTKVLFSLGWPVEYIVLRSLELFVLFYYTQVLGLPGTLAGLALFIAMLVDAFADPAIGSFSDNLQNSKFGRRHSLMFLAPIPLGIALVALFSPPGDMGQWPLFAWLVSTTVAVRFLCGLYVVPYSAQLAELTKDPAERASLQLYKSIAQTLFDSAMLAIAFNFFFIKREDGSGGQLDPSTYLPFALTLSAALILTTSISALGTWRQMTDIERRTGHPSIKNEQKLGFKSIGKAWKKVIFESPNIRAIVLGGLMTAAATSVMRTLVSHMGVFFWELSPQQIGLWQQASIPGFFAGMILSKILVRRVELINLILTGLVLIVGAVTVLPVLKMLGLVANGDLLYKLLLGANFVMGCGSGTLLLVAGMLCAEAADEDEYLTGVPAQAFLFGFVFLATKMGSAVGKLATGVALDLIEFPKGASSAPPEVVHSLAWMFVVSIGILGAISYYFWSRFNLTRERHKKIREELRLRELSSHE
jgi:glycoside/pentoside/hexuronide:cation symporter, GPH family